MKYVFEFFGFHIFSHFSVLIFICLLNNFFAILGKCFCMYVQTYFWVMQYCFQVSATVLSSHKLFICQEMPWKVGYCYLATNPSKLLFVQLH